jgi:hypothetical protein
MWKVCSSTEVNITIGNWTGMFSVIMNLSYTSAFSSILYLGNHK